MELHIHVQRGKKAHTYPGHLNKPSNLLYLYIQLVKQGGPRRKYYSEISFGKGA